MQKADCYYLGVISRKHGLKGELVIHLDTDSPQDYINLASVFVDFNGIPTPFFINQRRLTPKGELVALFDYDHPENLIGKSLYLPLSELPILNDNQFYYHEIIDFQLFDRTQGHAVGTIKQVLDYPHQTLMEIRTTQGISLIPMVDAWEMTIDRSQKFLLMTLPEGILELASSKDKADDSD